jgi:hypothetical protein
MATLFHTFYPFEFQTLSILGTYRFPSHFCSGICILIPCPQKLIQFMVNDSNNPFWKNENARPVYFWMLYRTKERSCNLPENGDCLDNQELILAIIFSIDNEQS